MDSWQTALTLLDKADVASAAGLFLKGLAVWFLLWIFQRTFNIDPKSILKLLFSELKDLSQIRWTEKAINMLTIVLSFLFMLVVSSSRNEGIAEKILNAFQNKVQTSTAEFDNNTMLLILFGAAIIGCIGLMSVHLVSIKK